MKNLFKKIIPAVVREHIRTRKNIWYDTITNLGRSEYFILYCGYKLFYSRGMNIIGRIRGGKIFEPEMVKAIALDLNVSGERHPLFLDIGANIGLVSLYILSTTQAVIYGFEPGPHQSSLLEKTISVNGLDSRLHLEKVALSNKTGKNTFFVHDSKDVSKDGLANTGRGSLASSIQVMTRTLDEWWLGAGKPRINVIKIDVEGAELLILRGADQVLSQIKPIIYLEIEPKNLRVYSFTVSDVENLLHSYHYILEKITPDTMRAS